MILEQSDEFVDFRLYPVDYDSDIPHFLAHFRTHLPHIFSYLSDSGNLGLVTPLDAMPTTVLDDEELRISKVILEFDDVSQKREG